MGPPRSAAEFASAVLHLLTRCSRRFELFGAHFVVWGCVLGLAGCGGSGPAPRRGVGSPPAPPHRAKPTSGAGAAYKPVRVVDAERSLVVRNPGTRYAYSAWLSDRVVYVFRRESVQIAQVQTEPTAFTSARAYAAWRHGQMALPKVGSRGTVSLKERDFSLLGTGGTPVTSLEAAHFGSNRAMIDAAVESAISAPTSRAGSQRIFDAFAHLLAFGPLTYAARRAVKQSMLSLPTATPCTSQHLGRNDTASSICLAGNRIRERVTLDPRSDRVLGIVEYLNHENVLYPDISPGGMSQLDTFPR